MINSIKYRFHIYNVRYHIFLIGRKLKLNPKLSSILSYDSDLLKSRKSLSEVMYKELGGRYVTVGSDAHIADNIGYRFDTIKDIIKK